MALVLALVPLLLNWPTYVTIPMAVFGTLLVGRLLYRLGEARVTEGEGKP